MCMRSNLQRILQFACASRMGDAHADVRPVVQRVIRMHVTNARRAITVRQSISGYIMYCGRTCGCTMKSDNPIFMHIRYERCAWREIYSASGNSHVHHSWVLYIRTTFRKLKRISKFWCASHFAVVRAVAIWNRVCQCPCASEDTALQCVDRFSFYATSLKQWLISCAMNASVITACGF